jgi:hypothetical protein
MKNNKREPPNRFNLHNALRGATFVCIIGFTAVGALGLWSAMEKETNDTVVSFTTSSRQVRTLNRESNQFSVSGHVDDSLTDRPSIKPNHCLKQVNRLCKSLNR